MERILYFAIADGRGHLMRAQLLRRLLAPRGIDVDIVTTSDAGATFLRGFGVSAKVLPHAFDLQFDDKHRLDEKATRRKLLETISPARARTQLRQLEAWARGAAVVVNDSMYPLLLLEAAWRKQLRVVQVVGENIHRTAWHRVHRERVPALRFAGQVLLRRSFEKSFARVFHSLTASADGPRTFHVPPLLAAPTMAPNEVRASLGAARIAAVYLNPHYRDDRIAKAIENATRASGLTLYGVSEPFAARPGRSSDACSVSGSSGEQFVAWRSCDPCFVDKANAADVLISGAGMAALEQSRVLGVPLIALLGRQPEQEVNVIERPPAAVLRADSPTLEAELTLALRSLPAKSITTQAHDIQQQWVSIFEALIHAARTEEAHGKVSLTRHRNGEPQGRWRAAR